MILSFGTSEHATLRTASASRPSTWIRRAAEMKLDQVDAAISIRDLALPGNRLEALKGLRRGQHSIRINEQWRLCFEWRQGARGPTEVEIVDYH